MHFKDLKGINALPVKLTDVINSNWLYTIIIDSNLDRDELITRLKIYGIETRPVFYPLSQMPPYRTYRTSSNLEVSNKISAFGISLPTSIKLTDNEIDYVAEVVKKELNSMMNRQ